MEEDAKTSWEKALFAALNGTNDAVPKTSTPNPNLNSNRYRKEKRPHGILPLVRPPTNDAMPSGVKKPRLVSLFSVPTDSSDSDIDLSSHRSRAVPRTSRDNVGDLKKTGGSGPSPGLASMTRDEALSDGDGAGQLQNKAHEKRMGFGGKRTIEPEKSRTLSTATGVCSDSDSDKEFWSFASAGPKRASSRRMLARGHGTSGSCKEVLKSDNGRDDNKDGQSSQHKERYSGWHAEDSFKGKGKGNRLKRRKRDKFSIGKRCNSKNSAALHNHGGLGSDDSNSSISSSESSELSWSSAASDGCRPRGSARKRRREERTAVIATAVKGRGVNDMMASMESGEDDVLAATTSGAVGGASRIRSLFSRQRYTMSNSSSHGDEDHDNGGGGGGGPHHRRRYAETLTCKSSVDETALACTNGHDTRKPSKLVEKPPSRKVLFNASGDDDDEEKDQEERGKVKPLEGNATGNVSSGKGEGEIGDDDSELHKVDTANGTTPRKTSIGRVREHEQDREEGDSEEDELDEDKRLKPTIVEPPFLDAEMMPLRLENEDGSHTADVPAATNRYLRGFQKDGVKFMWNRIRAPGKPKGVILADDMGLGKTVQIMALLSALLKKTGTKQDVKDMNARLKQGEPVSATGRPILIVSPASVVQSWEKHLGLWGHFARASIVSGRQSIERVKDQLNSGRLEVVCVGYDLFTNHKDTIAGFDWLVVIFDEVHMLKNPKSKRSLAVEKLKDAEVFIGLTGTLIQNDLSEFWWLMNVIEPGCLKTMEEFSDYFKMPILLGGRKGASRSDVIRKKARLEELGVIRDKMVLRRNKEDELGDLLKGKVGTVVFCELSPVQAEIYQTVLSLPEFKLLAVANDPCSCGRGGNSAKCCGMWPADDTSPDGVSPNALLWRKYHETLEVCGPPKVGRCPYCCCLPALTKLQKIANHPSLLQVDTSLKNEQALREQIAFAELSFTLNARGIMAERDFAFDGEADHSDGAGCDWDRRLARSNNFLQLCRDDLCGKMKTVRVLLKRFRKPAQKVLLFSYSTAMLDILQALMMAQGYTWLRLDGSTPVEDRARIIRQYNEGDAFDNFVFLISTRAGGTGLNLQTANKVILYDVNWNPTQDTQAEDRAYRIGQAGKVEVYRLVSTGTIEEMTYMRQISKLQTSAATMGDKAEGGLRQFEGVQGVRSQQGELWGVGNLMRYSGESMLLKLRAKHSVLPPIVPEGDGLVMEREQNVIDIVNRATGTAPGRLSTDSVAATGAAAIPATASEHTDQAHREQQGNVDEGNEHEHDEAEAEADFDGVRGSTGRGRENGGSRDDGEEDRGHEGERSNDDLGGVAMPHDEMVAADQEEDLPEASQQSLDVVELGNEGHEEDHDNDIYNDSALVVNNSHSRTLNGRLSDAEALSIAISESLHTAAVAVRSRAAASVGAFVPPTGPTAEAARFQPIQSGNSSSQAPKVSQGVDVNEHVQDPSSPAGGGRAGATAQRNVRSLDATNAAIDPKRYFSLFRPDSARPVSRAQATSSGNATNAERGGAVPDGRGLDSAQGTAGVGRPVSLVSQDLGKISSDRPGECREECGQGSEGPAAGRVPDWASAATQQSPPRESSSPLADVAAHGYASERTQLENDDSREASTSRGDGELEGSALPSWGWAQEANSFALSEYNEAETRVSKDEPREEMSREEHCDQDAQETCHQATGEASERTELDHSHDGDPFSVETQVEPSLAPA